jgi:hypothetical protein
MHGDLTYSYDGWSRFRLQLPAVGAWVDAIEQDLDGVVTETA